MKPELLKKIWQPLPFLSPIEISYSNMNGVRESRLGYTGRLVEEIPDIWKKDTSLPPYIEIYTLLDKNNCPTQSIDIRVRDIFLISYLTPFKQ